YDPAHQAVGDDDRRLRRDARARAAIDGERAHPAAALAPDHLTGQRGHGQALTEAEEPAQPIVLLASLDDLQRLNPQPLVLRPQLRGFARASRFSTPCSD